MIMFSSYQDPVLWGFLLVDYFDNDGGSAKPALSINPFKNATNQLKFTGLILQEREVSISEAPKHVQVTLEPARKWQSQD